ncbi:hypothetical protein AWZ03_010704 [Drosophila navojoa]|uniref:ADP-ribosylation factor-like protein 6 n=1 Tax=Drosophila navojoa TaxID=7232 RepID=A0A484B2F6_DRONA|nr:hypothetical protein AWZ03_010704 [Drosophila navojoa]
MGMLHNLTGLIKVKKDKMTILVLGLNNSGKSTIINHFKKSNEQSAIMVPTVGFLIEQFYMVVKDELDLVLQHPDLRDRILPILFYGNKSDLEDSLSNVKIAAALGLENIKDKPWHICSSNAISGEGLDEGIQWLVQQIRFALLSNRKGGKMKMVSKDIK